MKTSKLAIAAASLILAAGTVFVALRSRVHRPGSAVTLLGSAQAARTVGQQRRWALSFDVRLAQPGRDQPLRIELAGDWAATISAAREREYDVVYEVAGARVGGGGVANASPADVEELRRRLGRRFWVTYRNDGAALRVHFPKNVDPSDRNLLQMIVTATQLSRPEGEQTHWTAVERDAAGSYLAAYQRTGLQIVKRKMKYLEVDGAAGLETPDGVQIHLDESVNRFSLDAAGDLIAFEGSERIRVGMPMGEGGWLDVRATTRLANLRVSAAPELANSLERSRNEVDSAPIRSHAIAPEVAREQRDRRLLEGHTMEDLFAAARSSSEDTALPSRLAALIRQKPDAVPAAIGLVRKSGGLKRVTDALAVADTLPALKALATLARDPAAPMAARIDALTALVLVQRPSVEAMRIPRDLLGSQDLRLRRAARLISATLARAGRNDHPEEAQAIDQQLLSQYADAQEPEPRTELLSALGNSVGPAVVPVLVGVLGDKLPVVRAAAVRALRLAQHPAVNGAIAAAIREDRDPSVRSAAIFAAGFRPIGPFVEPLLRAATKDSVDYVRSDAVGLLSHNGDASPKIAEELAWVAEHDPKPAIRRLAKEAAGLGHQGG